ncbi:hypothetical protein M0R01_01160 [bacterium]|nr:hypothetical protein [bacterium]
MTPGFEFVFNVLANLVVELPILFIISKFIMKWGYETDHVIFSGTIGTLMRLSYVFFVFPLFVATNVPYYLYILQTLGVLTESVVLYNTLRIDYKKALIISILLGVASFLFSPKVFYFITTGKF